MELKSNSPLSPISILSGSLPVGISLQGLSLVVKNTLKIWYQFRKHFRFSQAISLLPIAKSHLLPPSQIDTAFQVWHKNGLVFLGDLFVKGTIASLHSYTYIHYKKFTTFPTITFAKKHFPFPSLPPKNATDIILDLDPTV